MNNISLLISIIFSLFGSLFLVSCSNLNKKTIDKLSLKEQDNFKYSISRYVVRLPPKANDITKFNVEFDSYYKGAIMNMKLSQYYKVDDNDTIYFEVQQKAPSLKKKHVATGGKIIFNNLNEIVYYEELYRTWKLEKEILLERSELFFNTMINNKDLSMYYTENINSDSYIEFPNKMTTFDKVNRKWIIKNKL